MSYCPGRTRCHIILIGWLIEFSHFPSGLWCFSTLWPWAGFLASAYVRIKSNVYLLKAVRPCHPSHKGIDQWYLLRKPLIKRDKCMYGHHIYSRVWINRLRLPILLVVSWTGKVNIPLSPCVPDNLVSRDGFSRPVPRQPAHLHTQAESDAYLRDPSRVPRRRLFMKPSYAIGSVPSLSGHASAYRWRSLPRVRRHRASKPQGSSERVLPWQVTMYQLICCCCGCCLHIKSIFLKFYSLHWWLPVQLVPAHSTAGRPR